MGHFPKTRTHTGGPEMYILAPLLFPRAAGYPYLIKQSSSSSSALDHSLLSLDKDMSLRKIWMSSVQFSSIAQLCLTTCDPMGSSTPGFLVHHQLPELVQIHVHWISVGIQLSHPLSSPSPPAINLSHHQGLFQWVSSSHQVAKVLEPQLQHQSFQWIFRTDFL